MRKYFSVLLTLLVLGVGCSEDTINEPEFVPTDVILKTKSYYPVEDVFDFINSLDHEVEVIHGGVYTSSLPNDSLQYIQDYVNVKPYIDSKTWPLSGYVSAVTGELTFFPRFFNMKNKENQQDWLATMAILQLSEKRDNVTHGYTILFHVPAGQEKFWVKEFQKLEFVDWVELNYYSNIQPT